MNTQPRVWLVSVPHSGTMFTWRLLERMGLWVRHTHCMTVGGGWVRQGRSVVVPLRPYRDIAASARRRGDTALVRLEDYQTVLMWLKLPNVHYFKLTGDNREMDRLAAFTGRPVPDYDWTPVNAA